MNDFTEIFGDNYNELCNRNQQRAIFVAVGQLLEKIIKELEQPIKSIEIFPEANQLFCLREFLEQKIEEVESVNASVRRVAAGRSPKYKHPPCLDSMYEELYKWILPVCKKVDRFVSFVKMSLKFYPYGRSTTNKIGAMICSDLSLGDLYVSIFRVLSDESGFYVEYDFSPLPFFAETPKEYFPEGRLVLPPDIIEAIKLHPMIRQRNNYRLRPAIFYSKLLIKLFSNEADPFPCVNDETGRMISPKIEIENRDVVSFSMDGALLPIAQEQFMTFILSKFGWKPQ